MSETAFLLDVNMLIALAWPNHVHHVPAKEWFHTNHSSGWRTCPITQSAFIRISSNPTIIEEAATPMEAQLHLKHMTDHPKHCFISDIADFSKLEDISFPLFHSHRQVTDYYLLLLAKHNDCRLATLDGKLAQTAKNTRYAECVFYIDFKL